MKVGIPKGLLYYKYYPFLQNFFSELGAQTILSEDTNKKILNEGVKFCVDEACLPIKVFHGHVYSIKDKCDLMIIPRIMNVKAREFICPKFCALPEMVENSIPNMPAITKDPLNLDTEKNIYKWCKDVGKMVTKDEFNIKKAYEIALKMQKNYKFGIKDEGYKLNIALLGHTYNVYDKFLNMNLVKKLNNLGVGVITNDKIDDIYKDENMNDLKKRPFWSNMRSCYGTASYLFSNKKINGIVFISSFACGIDSVILELIKYKIGDYPMLVLKIDEETGEAGIDTRIEAFADMLERRRQNENNISTYGQCLHTC